MLRYRNTNPYSLWMTFVPLCIQYKSCHPSNLKGAISSSPFSYKGKGPLSLAVHQTDIGKENAIDVSEGWLELVMICQCCGPLQEGELMHVNKHNKNVHYISNCLPT